MLIHRHKQRGVTLVELMIAGVIALIALPAVLTVYSASARHSAQLLQQAHLHHQLHALMHLISRDLKRAGYWHFDPKLRAPSDNPFQNATNQIRIQAHSGESPDSCVLFSYDLDQDGLVGVGGCDDADCVDETDDDNVEQFGFRLHAARVQSRYGGSGLECESGYWQTVTDPAMEMTQLQFTQQSSCLNLLEADRECTPESPRLIQRAVEIQLSGQLRNRPDTNLAISQWVRIRNDQLREENEW
ncbi:MAG: prepilin-type N-terminal cleavage/methylation domain-containing protein [Pseudomonadota bacterium]|nr:prepilin-type N-terminal cleavage/methylation domain-containing protein [Pseudomonadota bacterium]